MKHNSHKKSLFFLVASMYALCAAQDGQVFTMTVVPDEVEVINITPYNNNRHIIEYKDGKGTVIKADDSWKKKVLVTDPNVIKALSRKSNAPDIPTQKREALFSVVNNNDHTIVQNNLSLTQNDIKPSFPSENKNSMASTSYFALLGTMLNDHKYKIILGTCGMCWLAIYARLSYLSYNIHSSNGWRNWSKHLTLDALQQTDQTVLVQNLLQDIQSKYAKNKSPILPVVSFITDVDIELEQIHSFLHLHEALHTIKLSFIFPKQAETIRLAIQQIQKLEFFKAIIIQATPEFKKNYLI